MQGTICEELEERAELLLDFTELLLDTLVSLELDRGVTLLLLDTADELLDLTELLLDTLDEDDSSVLLQDFSSSPGLTAKDSSSPHATKMAATSINEAIRLNFLRGALYSNFFIYIIFSITNINKVFFPGIVQGVLSGSNKRFLTIFSHMTNRNTFGRLILFIVLGLIIGGVLGECLGLLFGELGELMNAGGYDNIVHNFFVKSFSPSFGFNGDNASPAVLDLYMIKLALGISFKFNVVSIIGMAISIYIMKWSGGNR